MLLSSKLFKPPAGIRMAITENYFPTSWSVLTSRVIKFSSLPGKLNNKCDCILQPSALWQETFGMTEEKRFFCKKQCKSSIVPVRLYFANYLHYRVFNFQKMGRDMPR